MTQAIDRIVTRPVLMLFVCTLGSLGGFYLLAAVVPLYAAGGGAGTAGAGLTTGVMMFATVLTELAVPRLLSRFGYRVVMGAGLVLLGAPALLLAGSAWLPLILFVCLLRGFGLGILVVAGAALSGELAPAGRRGAALALYGLASTIPSIACVPLGPWLADRIGFAPVFQAGAVLALVVVPAVLGLPAGRHVPGGAAVEPSGVAAEPSGGMVAAPSGVAAAAPSGGMVAAMRDPRLTRPAVAFGMVTLAAGAVWTFLPLAVAGPGQLAAAALLAQSIATPLGRLAAGWYGDRHGADRILVPALVISAAGTVALVWIGNPAAVIGGMAVFGAGLGLAQNASLSVMFDRVPPSGLGRASALWNLAFDAGIGIGAIGFGILVGWVPYPVGFAVVAGVVLAALLPAWRDRSSVGSRPSPD